MPSASCRLAFALSFLSATLAALQTVTIDDSNGDKITYNPPGYWNYGPTCTSCYAHPDGSQAYEGTWRDTTYIPANNVIETAEVSFTGSAVSVYGILGHGPTFSATDVTFIIDGQEVGHYNQQIDNGDGFDYNVLLFSTQSLSNTNHHLTIRNGRDGGSTISMIILDRIVYSFDDGSSSPSQGNGNGNGNGNSGNGSSGNQNPTSSQGNSQPQSATSSSSSNPTSNPSISSGGGTSPTGTNPSSSPTGTNTSPSTSGSTSLSSPATSVGSTAISQTTSAPGSDTSDTNGVVINNSDTKKSNTSTIIGIVVGVVVLVLLLLLLLCLFLRRSKRNRSWLKTSSDPSIPPPVATDMVEATSATRDESHLTALPIPIVSRRRRQDPAVTPFEATQEESVSSVSKSSRHTPPRPPLSAFSEPYDDNASSSHISSSPSVSQAPRMYHLAEKGPLPGTPSVSSQQSHIVELETAVLLAAENQRLREENRRLREQDVLSSVEEELPPPYLQARSG